MVGHSASPSVPCRYINGAPLPPRARLSLQPLISIVRRTNSMVHPRSRFARREKVGEVGNRLKHFLMPRRRDSSLRAGLRGFDEQAEAFNGVTERHEDRNGWAILATGVRLKDECTHLWRHAAHASRARIDLADLRFPY